MQSNTTSDVTENQVVLNNAAPDKGSDKGSDKGMEKDSATLSAKPDELAKPDNGKGSAKDNGHGLDSGSAKSSDAAAADDKSAECQGAGNREQLRRRVDSRVAELEAEASKLCEGANTERAQALSTALQIARDVTSTGWEHVGEMEAARLSQWLDSTEPLVATGKQEETGVMMGGAKPSTGAMNQATAPLNATTTPEAGSLPQARPVTADYPRS